MSATAWQKSYKSIPILQNISSFYTTNYTRSALATLDTSRIKRIFATGQEIGMVATLRSALATLDPSRMLSEN